MTENWKDIDKNFDHKYFGEFNKENWVNNGFNYHQVKILIKNIGLKINDWDFAWWLVKNKNKSLSQLSNKVVEELREELERDWKDINKDFSSIKILKWMKENLSVQEAQKSIEKGLTPDESDFANYLKKKYNSSIRGIKEIRKEYYQAQKWLDWNYLYEQRQNVKSLEIRKKNLKGSLKLDGFNNLEKFDCSDNQITSLDCSDCPKLKILNCRWNELTKLNLDNCTNIVKIFCNRNFLTNLDFLSSLDSEKLEQINLSSNNIFGSNLGSFRRFTNLKELGLGNWKLNGLYKENHSHFYGSLEPLKKCVNLEELDIAGTDIDSGLEYLPSEKLYIFYCFAENNSESKVKSIENKLREYGKTNEDKDNDDTFAILLGKWRESVKSDLISNVPSEKFYLIKTNIEKFFYKWGGEEIKNLKEWTIRNELYGKINSSIQWTNRVASVIGGSLLLVNASEGGDNIIYNQTGGIIAVLAPFIETVTSTFEKNFSEEKKRKWEEFSQDAGNLFANFHDLENLIPSTSSSYPQKINKSLQSLNAKTYNLLEKYDGDKNLEIDKEEWEIARKQFPFDLKDNWERKTKESLKEILKSISNLEEKTKEVYQGIFYELDELEIAKKDSRDQIIKMIRRNNLDVEKLNHDLGDDWEKCLEKLGESQKVSEFIEKIKNEFVNKHQDKEQSLTQQEVLINYKCW